MEILFAFFSWPAQKDGETWWPYLLELFQYDPKSPLLFNSGTFLLLFAAFMTIYALIYRKPVARGLYVIAFSLFFYYMCSGVYLLIFIASVIFDFYIGLALHQSKKTWMRKALVVLSLVMNLGILGYFKYTNFILDSSSGLFGDGTFEPMDIFLPIGISFYTFQTLGYVIDVYRKSFTPTKSLLDYTFYMTFFPQLVAGPIVVAKEFLPQIKKDLPITKENLGAGLFMIAKGLFKKAVIADYVAQFNDLVFTNPTGYSGLENLMALYGYTLQIYGDFSGYSDMAIGIALLMGFKLGDNFNSPYKSLNITEFWRRWHISLSRWLKDYLYISLGGNRKGTVRTYVNLLVTMLLGGLWHGANWKFVFWGGMHGFGLAVHKFFETRFGGQAWYKSRLATVLAWFLTFHFVAFLWVYFRADSFATAALLIEQVFTGDYLAYFAPLWETRQLFVVVLLGGLLLQFVPWSWKLGLSNLFTKAPALVKALILLAVIQLVIEMQAEYVQPFIYFQF